jgi:HlyD family secretion protein
LSRNLSFGCLRRKKNAALLSFALAVAAISSGCRASSLGASAAEIPTTAVQQSDLQIKVFTTGTLRTTRSTTLAAPAIAGGTLRITRLARSGTPVHAGDVVLEFDPNQQEYNLSQNRSDLQQAEQEIIKAKADADVQTAEDQTALLKARYAVRQAELEVSKNELISQIDAQKNLLALEEAKRALAQLQKDVQSHSVSNEAALAVSTEKRNKARIAMQQAEQNIQNMRVKSPLDGLVIVRGNEDSTGGFFFTGMTLPDYQVGDQANPGSVVAEVIDMNQLEISAKVGETERANLKSGLAAEAQVDALPGQTFSGKLVSIASSAGGMFWGQDSEKKFEVTIRLDRTDARLRPGFATRLTILGDNMPRALSLPREAVFEKDGKSRVFVKQSDGFVPQEVKVIALSEGRAVVDGLSSGTLVALVNPENHTAAKSKSEGVAAPAFGPGAN